MTLLPPLLAFLLSAAHAAMSPDIERAWSALQARRPRSVAGSGLWVVGDATRLPGYVGAPEVNVIFMGERRGAGGALVPQHFVFVESFRSSGAQDHERFKNERSNVYTASLDGELLKVEAVEKAEWERSLTVVEMDEEKRAQSAEMLARAYRAFEVSSAEELAGQVGTSAERLVKAAAVLAGREVLLSSFPGETLNPPLPGSICVVEDSVSRDTQNAEQDILGFCYGAGGVPLSAFRGAKRLKDFTAARTPTAEDRARFNDLVWHYTQRFGVP